MRTEEDERDITQTGVSQANIKASGRRARCDSCSVKPGRYQRLRRAGGALGVALRTQ